MPQDSISIAISIAIAISISILRPAPLRDARDSSRGTPRL
jgi:hypothetical protein